MGLNGILNQRLEASRGLGLDVLRELERTAHRFGAEGFYTPAWEAANARLSLDPEDGSTALVLEWREADGRKSGEMVLNADGSLYAECEVLRALPGERRRLVDAVIAWGCEGAIHSEPRVLSAV